MRPFRKKKDKKVEKVKNVNEKPFEETNKVERLKLLCVIVNRNQGQFFINSFLENNIACAFDVYGKGTAPREIYDIIGMNDNKKDLVMALVKASDIEKINKIIQTRFNVSKQAKGISFTIPIDSMAGVVMYKFLTNSRERRS